MANDVFYQTFSKRIREGQYNTLYSQTVEQENRKQKQAEEQTESLAYNLATEHAPDLSTTDGKAAFDTEIFSVRKHAYEMGMRGDVANKLVYEGVARAAVEMGRPDIVNHVLETHTIDGTPLPPEVEANLRRASVLASNRSRVEREQSYATRREQGEQALIELAKKFVAAEDPASLDISEDIANLASIDAGLVGAANNLRREFIEAKRVRSATHSDGDVLRKIDANRSGAKTTLARLRAEGAITDEQFTRFMPYATNVEADTKPNGNSKLRFSVIAEYGAQLRTSLRGRGWDEEEIADKVADFTVEANNALLRDPDMDTISARKLLVEMKTIYDERKPEPVPQASASPEGDGITTR